jgi:hypothetical protein
MTLCRPARRRQSCKVRMLESYPDKDCHRDAPVHRPSRSVRPASSRVRVGKLRGITGPSSSAQITVACSGGSVEQAMTSGLFGTKLGVAAGRPCPRTPPEHRVVSRLLTVRRCAERSFGTPEQVSATTGRESSDNALLGRPTTPPSRPGPALRNSLVRVNERLLWSAPSAVAAIATAPLVPSSGRPQRAPRPRACLGRPHRGGGR